MTAAQRATLEQMVRDYKASASHAAVCDKPRQRDLYTARADALRAALGTCGTCKHLGEQAEGHGFCAAPAGLAGFPFLHYLMPLGERCTGWTPKEGA